MILRRAAALVLGTMLVGCALLTGASDLHTEEPEVPGIASGSEGGRPDAEDDRASALPDTALADTRVDAPVDSAADAAPTTRIREVTFENGTLTGPNGADVVVGAAAIETLLPIVGTHSLRVDRGDAVEIDFAPLPEIYATFLARFDNIGFSEPVFVRIGTDTLAVLDLEFPATHNSGIVVQAPLVKLGPGGSVSDNGGAVFRVGIHVRQVGLQTTIEVFVGPQGAAFGTAAVSGSVINVGKLRYIRIGSINDGNVKGTFDDLLVDSATMPLP